MTCQQSQGIEEDIEEDVDKNIKEINKESFCFWFAAFQNKRIEFRFADYIQHLRTAHLSGVTLISSEGHFFVIIEP